MGETAEILALWRRARAQKQRVCLATVVHVEGSSYRKPGARMLLTQAGERAGTVSGGCLEAEVSRKAWWLTADGPALEQYRSSFDDLDPNDPEPADLPWGLGCGGAIWLLLEQEPTRVLEALAASVESAQPAVLVAQLAPARPTLVLEPEEREPFPDPNLRKAINQTRAERRSRTLNAQLQPAADAAAWFLEYLAPPPRLVIFGAGDDAKPLARFADALGWRITIADGRSNLLRPERFPPGVELRPVEYPNFPLTPNTGVGPDDLVVLLTHSYEQDRALLAALLPQPLASLGILGPRHRTVRLLEEVAPRIGWSVEDCLARLHSPVGLDLGAHDPAGIALSIVSEMQATIARLQGRVASRAETIPTVG